MLQPMCLCLVWEIGPPSWLRHSVTIPVAPCYVSIVHCESCQFLPNAMDAMGDFTV